MAELSTNVYSSKRAAEYLNLSLAGFEYHLKKGNIEFELVSEGKRPNRVFLIDQLEAFNKIRPLHKGSERKAK